MNVLEKYEQERKCLLCSHHVTLPGRTRNIHFCGVSGKILLYPLYLSQNCKKFEVRGEIYAGE